MFVNTMPRYEILSADAIGVLERLGGQTGETINLGVERDGRRSLDRPRPRS